MSKLDTGKANDDNMDTDNLKDMVDTVGRFFDAGGDAASLIAFVECSASLRQRMRQSSTIDEVEDVIAEKAIMPIVQAALNDSDNAAKLVFPILSSYCESEVQRDLLDYLRAGDLTVSTSGISKTRIMNKFVNKCRNGIGYDEIDACLMDVATYHRQKTQGTLPQISKVKGVFTNLKAQKECLKRQAKAIITAEKQVHTKSEAEIWFSRYLLAAPIELAKEGFLTPISHIAFYGEELIRKECAFYAKQLGLELAEEDVNVDHVKSAMRAFCVNKTGYSHAAHWLAAAGVLD